MRKTTIVTATAAVAAAVALAYGGAALASADETTPYTSAAQSTAGPATQGQTPDQAPKGGNGNTDPSKPMRSDEKLLTGDTATKVTAAAKAREPGATIERVETDSDGVYEAHMVRADGTHIIVQVNEAFAVTNVQQGGPGGPGGPGAGGTGAKTQQAPASGTATSS